MVCHSLLQRTTFCQTSPPWSYHLGWPHTAWLSFIELDKAVVLWSDCLVFYDCGISVSALWCPLTTPTILLGFFSYLGHGVSLHSCSSKAQPLLLTFDEGYLLIAAPPDLEQGVAPLSPPAPHSSHSLEVGLLLLAAAPNLGRGSSSRPPPLSSDVGKLLSAAMYIMRNAGLEEAQAGIKIAGRNINNLRYADDTTLMAGSEEELKSLLMKVKEES